MGDRDTVVEGLYQGPVRRLLGALLSLALVLAGAVSVMVAEAPATAAATVEPPVAFAGKLSSPITWDTNTLYAGVTSQLGKIENLDGPLSVTQLATRMTGWPVPPHLSTLAVGPYGGTGGPLTGYVWYWGSGNGTGTGTNFIPVAAFESGSNTGIAYSVPRPAADGTSPAYNYWSGGEVFQKTGEIYFTSGECAALSTSFRMMIFNPATLEYELSGKISPATEADRITGGDSCSGTGYVASDMAIDANGNAYLLVGGTAGKTLVRVVPGAQGEWTYNKVMTLSAATGDTRAQTYFIRYSTVYGMAFLNGTLYANTAYSGGSLFAIDPISGIVSSRLPGGLPNQDLASAQTAPVLEGVVYNDANGNGVIESGEKGLANQEIGLYSEAGVLLGTRITDSLGQYSFIVNSATDKYDVRLIQPRIDGVNATQTYASANGGDNAVTAYCAVDGEAKQPRTSSGRCDGAKLAPFTDPTTIADGDVASEAAFYSTLQMNTDGVVAKADFGVTRNGSSFGDAPTGYPVTLAEKGPVHINGTFDRLRLGDVLGNYSDGAHHAAANGHDCDDGVFVVIDGTQVPVQDAAMSVGRTYPLIAKVNGSRASSAQVRAWVTRLTASGVASASFDANAFTSGQPEADGTYRGQLTLSTQVPAAGIAPFYLRVGASTATDLPSNNSAGSYMPERGSAAANTAPWTVDGEVEDYRAYATTAQVRLSVSTRGQGAGPFEHSLTNVSSTAPSSTTTAITTTAADTPVDSGQLHAFSTVNGLTGTTINTTRVPTGWSLGKATCSDGDTPVAVTTSGNNITLPGAAIVQGADISCQLTYGLKPSGAESSLSMSSGPKEANGSDAYTVTATVKDSAGNIAPDTEVSFTADPTTGATLSDNTCTTNDTGSCQVQLTATRSGTYNVHATVQGAVAGEALSNSPVSGVFTAGEPSRTHSTVTIDDDTVIANGIDTHTVTIKLADGHNNPVLDGESELNVVASPDSGVTLGTVTATATPGTYTVTVASTVVGSTTVVVTYGDDEATVGSVEAPFVSGAADPDASALVVSPVGPIVAGTGVYTATATVRDANGHPIAGQSVDFAVTGAATVSHSSATTATDGTVSVTVSSTTAGTFNVSAKLSGTDIAGSPAPVRFIAGPPAFGSGQTRIAIDTADAIVADGTATHDATVTVVDQYGNPVADQSVTFSVQTPAVATTATTVETGTDGTATVSVASTTAGSFNVTATVEGTSVVSGAPAVATFAVGVPSASMSEFSVTAGDRYANGTHKHTATVLLKDAYGNSVSNAAAAITITAPGTSIGTVTESAQTPGTYTVSLTATTPCSPLVTAQLDPDVIGTPATVRFVPLVDLAITKSAPATAPVAGADATWTLTVTNNGPSDATDVVVTDVLPTGVTYTSATNATCSTVAQTVTCEVPTLTNGAQVAIGLTTSVPANTASGTVFRNAATVASDDDDPDEDNNTAPGVTSIASVMNADLATTMTAPATPPVAGSNTTWRIEVTNNGPSTATGVVVTDPLPIGLQYVSATGATCSALGQMVTCNVGTIANGSTATIDLTTRVATYVSAGTVFTNTATATSNATDTDPSNNTGQAEADPLTKSADLEITKSASATPPVAGANTTWTIAVKNNGPSDTSNVVVTDALPAGLTYVTAAGASCSAAGQIVTCNVGALAFGESTSLRLTTKVAADTADDATFSNTATVASEIADPDLSNNESPATVTEQGTTSADVSISKTAPATTPVAGGSLDWTLTVRNDGPSVARNVVVTDVLESHLSFTSATGATCTNAGQTVTCNLGDLDPEQTVPITLTTGVDGGTPSDMEIKNSASVATDTPDPEAANNTAPEVSAGLNSTDADLEITKTKPQSPPVAGANSVWEMKVYNHGPSNATDVEVEDVLPSQLKYVSATGATCSPAGQTVTCHVGDMANGDEATIRMTVTVASDTPAGTVVSNSASVAANEHDGNTSNNTTATVVADPTEKSVDLGVTKLAPNTAPVAGEDTAWSITVINNGPSDATNIVLTDILPMGLTYVSATNATCQDDDADGTVDCTIPGLTAGSQVLVELVAHVPENIAPGVIVANSALVSSDAPDTNNDNNKAPDVEAPPVEVSADLGIAKTAPNVAPVAGESTTWGVTVTNNGPSDAVGVVVTDVLPAQLSYVSATGAMCTSSGQKVTCQVGALANGASVTIGLTTLVAAETPTGAQIANKASVTSTTPDPDDTNGETPEVESPKVESYADLAITKSAPSTTPIAGESTTWGVTVTNNGPSDAIDVRVTDELASELSYVSATGATCSASGQIVTCHLGTVANGATATIQLTTLVAAETPTGTQIANKASVSSTTPRFDPGGSDSESPEVESPETTRANNLVAGVNARARITAGDTFTYTVWSLNDGPSTAENVELLIPADRAVTITSVVPSVTNTDRVRAATPSCANNGDGTWLCQIATLAPGERLTAAVMARHAAGSNGPIVLSASTTQNPAGIERVFDDNKASSTVAVSAATTVTPSATGTADPTVAAVSSGTWLPWTGTEVAPLVAVAVVLLGGGLLLVFVVRRRRVAGIDEIAST